MHCYDEQDTDLHEITINETLYYYSFNVHSYDNAQTKCQQTYNGNGRLFEPQSFDQMQYILDEAMADVGMTHIWLGIHDRSIEENIIYASSGSKVPSTITDSIIVSNGCDTTDCDLLYYAGDIFTVGEGYELHILCEQSSSSKFVTCRM